MDLVGDGTGSINGSVAGSLGSPISLIIKPQPTQILYVTRILIFIEDSGTLDSGGFGNGAALTNGIIFRTYRWRGQTNEEILPSLQENQLPIKKNQEFKALCHDEIFSNYGSGSQSLSWRYTFTKDTNGEPLALSGPSKEELHVVIQDDITKKCESLYIRAGCYV
jgi:hypothetical protein